MQVSESAEKPASRSYPVFWFTFWLGVLLCQCKIIQFNIFLKSFNFARGSGYLYNLWIIVEQDVMYTVIVGILGWGLVRLTNRHRKIQKTVWGLWLTLCLASALYGLANVVIYQEWRRQLTYHVLAYALHSDGGGNLWSSIRVYATPLTLGVIAGCFAFYMLAVLLSARFIRLPRNLNLRWQLALNVGVLLIAATSCALGERFYVRQWQWSNRPRALHANPHWTLLRSTWNEASGKELFQLSGGATSNDFSDFQTIGERSAGPSLDLPASQRPKNVILIVMESVAARYLSIYGAPYDSTPHLREEAQHCLIFDNFYSNDVATATSLFTLLTSRYPRLSWNVMTYENVPETVTTFPQVLRSAGYSSAFITASDLTWANQRTFLNECGFDVIRDYHDLAAEKLNTWGTEDRYLIDGILKFLDERKGQPFAVVAWTNQTHHPYTLARGQQKLNVVTEASSDLNSYLNCLHESDRQLGRLFEALRQRDLADGTLVVITGDHGEAFLDPHPIRGHGNDLYEECVKVPGIIWNPRLFSAAGRKQTIGGHIDLAPTILDYLGLKKAGTWQGRSLFDDRRTERAYFFSQLDYGLGVREGDWKLLYDESDDRMELYNLRSDPTEQNNVLFQFPAIRERMLHHLEEWATFDRQQASITAH